MKILSSLLLLSAAMCGGFDDPAETPVLRDHVELVEINHFYDEKGKLVFDQLIFYDWSRDAGRYMVRDWKLLKVEAQVPVQDQSDGKFIATWYDGETLRVVRADLVTESWTQYDPEQAEREFLPKQYRAELSRPIDRKLLR